MEYSFVEKKFVCVDAPRGPEVIELDVGNTLSTAHPAVVYDTEEEANVAAKDLDPAWQPESRNKDNAI